MTPTLSLESHATIIYELTDDVYTHWLDNTFKSVFKKYDGEEIPIDVLLFSLRKHSGSTCHQWLDRFCCHFDSNKVGKVTYIEFRRMALSVEPRDRSVAKEVLIALALKSFPDFVNSHLSSNYKEKKKMTRLKRDKVENYADRYRCCPPPIFIPLVIVAQMITFIIYGFQLIRENNPNNVLSWTTGLPKFSLLVFDVRKRHEIWRFVTYMVIHQGYLHIIFNCVIQLLLGIPIEMVYKFRRVCLIFMAGVLFGSLASSIIDKNSRLVGSSGGSYALLGAHYAIVIMNWNELQRDWLNINKSLLNFFSSGVVRLLLLTIFLVSDLGITLYRTLFLNVDKNISSSAHVGGLVAGLLIGIPCMRRSHKYLIKEKLFWVSFMTYMVLLIVAVSWNMFYPDYEKQIS